MFKYIKNRLMGTLMGKPWIPNPDSNIEDTSGNLPYNSTGIDEILGKDLLTPEIIKDLGLKHIRSCYKKNESYTECSYQLNEFTDQESHFFLVTLPFSECGNSKPEEELHATVYSSGDSAIPFGYDDPAEYGPFANQKLRFIKNLDNTSEVKGAGTFVYKDIPDIFGRQRIAAIGIPNTRQHSNPCSLLERLNKYSSPSDKWRRKHWADFTCTNGAPGEYPTILVGKNTYKASSISIRSVTGDRSKLNDPPSQFNCREVLFYTPDDAKAKYITECHPGMDMYGNNLHYEKGPDGKPASWRTTPRV